MKKLITCILLLLSTQSLFAKTGKISVFADGLYWHASEEASSFWTNVITTPQPNVTNFDSKNLNFDWNAGFRAGIQYDLDPRYWDTRLYWTYFPTKKNLNVAAASQIITPEFFSGFASGNFFFGASIDWRLVMNTVDLEVGHKFKISDSLGIRPSIGIKGAAINQTANANWNAVIYTSQEKVQNNFSGFGPTLGISGKWNVYDTLNLVGNFSTALMWGNWKVNDIYTRPSALFGLVTPTTITTSMNNSKLGTLMLDYFVGLEWDHPHKTPLTFKLGYEMQYWASQLRVVTFQQLPLHGDLTFQGATCGLKIDL